ncbi:MAG: large conductance mechanosensitive channel [Frankiaceae bacterium]|jgi:large conductance mechanosensitive channel|nr:large conductance mechanosensitive channel [Frankiaceae bacterium]
MSGFRKFLLRGNVVDLAVGIVIGAAFGAVVTAFSASFITPLVGLLAGASGDFSTKGFTLHHDGKALVFPYGKFVNALIAFVLIAAVVYFFVVVPVNKLMERYKPAPDEPTPVKECPECLSSIAAAARKCAYCASPQAA